MKSIGRLLGTLHCRTSPPQEVSPSSPASDRAIPLRPASPQAADGTAPRNATLHSSLRQPSPGQPSEPSPAKQVAFADTVTLRSAGGRDTWARTKTTDDHHKARNATTREVRQTRRDVINLAGEILHDLVRNAPAGTYDRDLANGVLPSELSKLVDFTQADLDAAIIAKCLSLLSKHHDTLIQTAAWQMELLVRHAARHDLPRIQAEIERGQVPKEALAKVPELPASRHADVIDKYREEQAARAKHQAREDKDPKMCRVM